MRPLLTLALMSILLTTASCRSHSVSIGDVPAPTPVSIQIETEEILIDPSTPIGTPVTLEEAQAYVRPLDLSTIKKRRLPGGTLKAIEARARVVKGVQGGSLIVPTGETNTSSEVQPVVRVPVTDDTKSKFPIRLLFLVMGLIGLAVVVGGSFMKKDGRNM